MSGIASSLSFWVAFQDLCGSATETGNNQQSSNNGSAAPIQPASGSASGVGTTSANSGVGTGNAGTGSTKADVGTDRQKATGTQQTTAGTSSQQESSKAPIEVVIDANNSSAAEIASQIRDVQDKSIITLEMGDATELDKEILESAKGKGIDIILDMEIWNS